MPVWQNVSRVYGGSTSSVVYIPRSVLQGSVLGLRLFILYSADLEDHVSERGVSFHAFADDMQLYLTLSSQQHGVGPSVT